ncbi:MAG: 2-oxo-4-hydroxy-4-carboxy-5-ureidoimidazoline decarboxylase [Rhodothermales bacterium]|nr:2-oxo-4-hydroxy-4-carboxy-5-ureidoimidazoline decarboxylase [Rhodothermales bacterium]MBO6778632.1 2-oxo-4-hydroxy-4-carboxy-5-ureidoimidazoline decarboxylase [Rhodothermales bacterium]
MTVAELDGLPAEQASAALRGCCGASAWVAGMVARRPFDTREALHASSRAVCAGLERADWLEAFAAHPRIGDLESLRSRFAHDRWAGGEQAGAAGASDAVLRALARRNDDYELRFGYIFIVCATGKSAEEMLRILESRLPNDPEVELRVAAEEQRKITELRLDKLLDPA